MQAIDYHVPSSLTPDFALRSQTIRPRLKLRVDYEPKYTEYINDTTATVTEAAKCSKMQTSLCSSSATTVITDRPAGWNDGNGGDD